MRLSEVVLVASLAVGAGILLASFFFSAFLFLALLWGSAVFLTFFWSFKRFLTVLLFVVVAGFGAYLYSSATALSSSAPAVDSFVGMVELPPERDERGLDIVVSSESFEGRALVTAPVFLQVRQGDMVKVSGELQLPSSFDGFDYPLYLAKEGISWVVFRPTIDVLEFKGSALSVLRDGLLWRIQTSLPSPQSALIAAMLLGERSLLPERFAEQLSVTGTRHITAVSGMHVAVLAGMLFTILLGVGLSRRKSAAVVLGFLVFFVALVGAPASAVRAGIMGSAMLAGTIVGRKNVSLRSLVLAGAFMLLLNPLLLAHDAGFQLSFLAVLGILLFLPVFQEWTRKVPNPYGMRDVVLMSMAAQVFTVPLVLSHFGILSLVSLAANLLIVPLLPAMLLLGAVFLLTGSIPVLGGIAAFLLGLLLSYVVVAVELLSRLPGAALEGVEFPFWLAFLPMLPAAFFAWRFQRERRFRFQEQSMIV